MPVGPALACERGHSFDVAKEGYVNLLGGVKLPALAGDSREMLQARRRFLEAGHYAPLAAALAKLIGEHLAGRPERGALLDAGCGEGFFLGALLAALAARGDVAAPCAFGTDIAKEAARLAARRHPGALFVVADTHRRLPFRDAALDGVLNVFAARSAAEFARVLRAGGILLVALPLPHHLAELRARLSLVGIEPDKEAQVAAKLEGAFELTQDVTVAQQLILGPDALVDLVGMTPSARHLSPAELLRARGLGQLEVTAAFRVLAFVRRA
jgi:23S rRNA (guanine745-N1)-methyltransferase